MDLGTHFSAIRTGITPTGPCRASEATCAPPLAGAPGFSSTFSDASELLCPLGPTLGPTLGVTLGVTLGATLGLDTQQMTRDPPRRQGISPRSDSSSNPPVSLTWQDPQAHFSFFCVFVLIVSSKVYSWLFCCNPTVVNAAEIAHFQYGGRLSTHYSAN